MDIPFSQAYKVLVRQNTRCSNRLWVNYDERNAAESSRQRQSFTYFLLKEEFGQYGKHGKIDPVGTDEIDPVKTA